ncbi:MAG: hypothetical protein EKK37_01590 [Sphingobacteriales bacterium]|nr:MAG: hypothetical protein EKK37_01590 [Sphingobacteriales bacterium]
MKRLVLILLVLTACKKDTVVPVEQPEILDVGKFTKVENPSILLSLKPTAAFDYVELRMSSGQGPEGNELYFVRASVGNITELKGTCLDMFKHLPVQEEGFAGDCTPLCYFNYLVAVTEKEVRIYNTLPALKSFLGEIDSESDAALTVVANGYEFDFNNKAVAGVRKVSNGYEILCKKRVKSCNPVQYDQFWLKVSTEGMITIKQEILYSTLDACI